MMKKHNVRIDSYLKEKITNRGKNISSACKTLISELPNEIINKLVTMSFDEAKLHIDYVYADFNNSQSLSKEITLSVRFSADIEYIINRCLTAWKEKANTSDVIKILLAVGIMYQEYKNKPSSSNILLSTKISPPYVCYQHGNKNNYNVKTEVTNILKQIPDDIQTVVEPFMGMCGLTINVLDTLTHLKFDYYVNDKDTNLTNLYKCIHKNTEKLFLSCEQLINHLKEDTFTFETVRSRYLDNNYDNNYDTATDYMYLDAVSVRHDKQTLKSDYKSSKKQIERFEKYIINIRAMHNYLIKTKIYNQDALKMLKKFTNRKRTLYLFDPPYIKNLYQ